MLPGNQSLLLLDNVPEDMFIAVIRIVCLLVDDQQSDVKTCPLVVQEEWLASERI